MVGGGLNTSFTVTIDGKATDYEYNGTPIKLILEPNKSYTIAAADKEGYITPNNIQGITMDGVQFNHNLIYNEKLIGVKIRDTSGKYYSVSSWDSTKQVDCIAIISDNYRFGIAVSNPFSGCAFDYFELKNRMDEYKGEFVDESDKFSTLFDGEEQTILLRDFGNLVDDTNIIDNVCDYQFPNGENSRLPSGGEFVMILQNLDDINDAMNVLGLSDLPSANNYLLPYLASTCYVYSISINSDPSSPTFDYRSPGAYAFYGLPCCSL